MGTLGAVALAAAVALSVVVLAALVLVLRRVAAVTVGAAASGTGATVAPSQAQEELEDARLQAKDVREAALAEAVEIGQRAREAAARAQAARDEADEAAKLTRDDLREQRFEAERREHRVGEREERLDAVARELSARSREISERLAEVTAEQQHLHDLGDERQRVLAEVAGLTVVEARAALVGELERAAKHEAAVRIRLVEKEAQEEADARARAIITTTIQRVASEQTGETVVSLLHLPSEEMKGRIIGREGRNIRAFESVTGVNLIIDDTPEAVLLSCFDPLRRETARRTLEALVLDGRIHPHRIEEAHARSREEVEQVCQRAGEDALVEVGLTDMDPALLALLGRLRFRTSYGQNVLRHLVECAHLGGLMAAELGLDPALVRRCAFLHDIGKALTHEVPGSHALVGAELARRHGEDEDVVHAIEAHHNEVAPRTLEAVLTQACDAISGGRPGARREPLEAYVRRLERLEEIATAHAGVDRVFAMQAGREVRVMVLPDAVDDIGAQVLARDIAKEVEHELTYPGQIRVTVIRESRATEFAR